MDGFKDKIEVEKADETEVSNRRKVLNPLGLPVRSSRKKKQSL